MVRSTICSLHRTDFRFQTSVSILSQTCLSRSLPSSRLMLLLFLIRTASLMSLPVRYRDRHWWGELQHLLPNSNMLVAISNGMWAVKLKSKVFPYSLPSIGPGADPSVQAVSPQVTWSESRHRPGSKLPLLSVRPAVTSIAFTRWRYL